ncbi:MAG TPA: molybdate ABC transporter substrate-binding protein [Chthoniobacteraceae bacterium]|jgi:molybdate transport system substrate-binding protein|nr:molybdate ABC transporter substrate-binding protein [Chthoniobacteraceae bacterium]
MEIIRKLSLLIALILVPLRAHSEAEPVLVAAAADLKFALDDLLVEFRRTHPGVNAKPTYGASGTLFAQIDNGAPFDLFLSADIRFPRELIDRDKADGDTLFLYAIGHLVIWLPNESRVDLAKLGAKTLLDPSIGKVAIANPDVAPYGAAAVAALKELGVHDAVRSKLVRGENVAQTAQFVQSGAAHAGIISLSLALSPKMSSAGKYWEIPVSAFPKLEQAGVIINKGRNRQGAEQLRAFLGSDGGREILKRYGFALPEGGR